MAVTTFDTHQAVKDLLAAGFADAQAEVVATMVSQASNGRLATKDDLAVLATKTDFAELKGDFAELKGDFSVLKIDVAETKIDVAGIKEDISGIKEDISGIHVDISELKQGFARLNSEMAVQQASLNNMKWMMGILITLIGIIAALFTAVSIRVLFFL